MIMKYRLDFISKRPATLKTAWREFVDAGLLTNNLGILSGSFLAESPELLRVLDSYERDKEKLDVRLESSCQVVYEQHDLDSHEVLKLYPPNAMALQNEPIESQTCEECGRAIGYGRVRSLPWARDVIVPNCALAMTIAGDLLLRADLIKQIQKLDGLAEYELDAVADPSGTSDWSVVARAPVAARVGSRAGFCHTCGGAVQCDALPEVNETYSWDVDRDFMLSPDRPALPCFSKRLAQWVVGESPCISWSHFKPIDLQTR